MEISIGGRDESLQKPKQQKKGKLGATELALIDDYKKQIEAKKLELAQTELQIDSRLRAVTERMVDDVYATREAQQHAVDRAFTETERANKQKQELAKQKRELAEQKRSLANRNDVLQARTSRQEAELQKLKEQLAKAKKAERVAAAKAEKAATKAAKAAEKTRPSIRGFLSNLLGSPAHRDSETAPAPKLPPSMPSTRILDLD
jgi:chromosome segregation ATPase